MRHMFLRNSCYVWISQNIVCRATTLYGKSQAVLYSCVVLWRRLVRLTNLKFSSLKYKYLLNRKIVSTEFKPFKYIVNSAIFKIERL